MPKVASGSNPPSGSPPFPSSTGAHPNVLKRNQACHQCRRRKLKCDAKRPCSTCVRSHAHAVAHAPAGTKLPPVPECTFDDVAESIPVNEGPKNRYERLENRINELETLLLQKENAERAGSSSSQLRDSQSLSPGLSFFRPPSGLERQPNVLGGETGFSPLTGLPLGSTTNTVEQLGNFTASSSASLPFSQFPHGNSMEGIGDLLEGRSLSPQDRYTSNNGSPQLGGNTAPTKLSPSQYNGLELFWPNWPPDLPPTGLLRHLVEVFFVFHPHANRVFHASTFMASLSLPPSHAKFPAAPVLHAICALGSFYTAAVSSPPLPDFAKVQPDEIFVQRYRIKEGRPDSFAEQQAQCAKETADYLESMGESLLQIVQARLLLSWFYWSHSRWRDVFMCSALTLRLAVPLGLNMCPPFHSITKSQRPPSIIPAARTVIEDETRRNIFWLAYATERQHGSGNGWALAVDDQDISQLLPLRGDQFQNGVLVTPHERQWAHSRDLLLVHPESQTDSFILYIKGTILMSRVKVFNHRFRALHYAGDPQYTGKPAAHGRGTSDDPSPPETIDPRGSPAFLELENIVASFRASFPSHLRTPITDNVVDSHLYTACLMPHAAAIVLHDPHADVRQSGCTSALKILTAARGILDLIYNVWSTSYDITLLDSFCSFCWFIAGRVLVRFLQAALAANSEDQIATLRTELEFVRLAIAKLGERIPLSYRFAKMLDDLTVKACGKSISALGSLDFTNHPSSLVNLHGNIGNMSYDPGSANQFQDLSRLELTTA